MKKILFFLALLLLPPSVGAQQVSFNKRAAIAISSSGSNQVIAGVANKQIAIYGIDLYCASSTTVKLQDASTDLTGAMTTTSYVKNIVQAPAYWTLGAGDAFNITLGGAVACAGAVWYTEQ